MGRYSSNNVDYDYCGGMIGGMVNPMNNMGVGMMDCGFNRWMHPGFNYQGMNGFNYIDYSGGWNPMVHDQMLVAKINIVFQRYDFNFSGALEGQ